MNARLRAAIAASCWITYLMCHVACVDSGPVDEAGAGDVGVTGKAENNVDEAGTSTTPARFDVEISEITLNQGVAFTLYSQSETDSEPSTGEMSPPEPEPEPISGAAFGEPCSEDADCQTQYCTRFLNTCGEQCESGTQGCAADPNCCPISGADTCFFGVCVASGGGGGGGGGGGAAAPVDVPAVVGRPGQLGVVLEPLPDFQGRELEVVVRSAGEVALTKRVALDSTADPDRNVKLAFTAEAIRFESGFQVQVRELGGGVIAAWPPAGEETFAPTRSTGTLRIVLVPVRYEADGSNRLPDLSDAQMQRYKDWLNRLYPLQRLELSVRESPLVVNYRVDTRGWSQFLQDVQTLRNQDRPANDVYYHALIAPTASFESFCGQGCVLGLGIVGTETEPDSRVSCGIGFTGELAASTLVHEVGHAHGREHAPCGLYGQPSDPAYPHEEAAIGTVGFDINTQQEIDANRKDMMSYCEPVWVSDYTYTALAGRMSALANPQARILGQPHVFEVLIVETDGALARGKPIEMPFVSQARMQRIEFLDAQKRILATRDVPSHRLGDGDAAFLYIAEQAPTKTRWVRHRNALLRWER